MPRIVPCLWFDSQAEEAAAFYASIFKNSQTGGVSLFGKEGHEIHGRPEGSVMTVDFEIEGLPFVGLNGGPVFQFNEAISFQVLCGTQEEVDYYWERLSEGGDPEAQQCGWLKDKFGVSWQIIPAALPAMMRDEDAAKRDRVMKAMLPMKRIEIAKLTAAFEGDG